MARKLASVLVTLAAISPVWVQALGLGEIQLNSFLNQPLDAQIEIISSTKGESDGIQVKLASQDAFVNSGLEFTNNLRSLKFAVITRSNGRQYIKVTTQKGFREPFLNFLLEVNWASGRIMREYSELVDPPGLMQSSPAMTQAGVTRQAVPATSAARQAPQPPLYGAPDRVDADNKGFIGDTYTTKRNDTAWQIANDARPDSQVTVEQSMMAILRANPEAFIRQNINRLKAGYVLSIPDRDSMLSQSHTDARAEVRQQTRAWKDRGRTQAAEAPKGRLEILPPQADATEASGSTTGSKTQLHREVMLAREATEAQRQENAELRLRVSELEEQITNAKRLTQLKADQMAALEKNLGEINAAKGTGAAEQEPVAPEAEEVTAPEAMEPPAAEAIEATEAPVAPTESAAATEAAKNIVEAVPAKPGTPVNQNVVSGFKPVDITKLPESALPEHPFKTGAAPGAAVEQSVGLVDQVIAYFNQNPVIKWVVAAVGGLLVLILGMLFVRSRKGDEQFEESILHAQALEETSMLEEHAAATETDATENLLETVDIDEAETAGKQDITDTSFLSDMVLSDMSDLQGEGAESDPLTEADVFLAYGRFGPAENMIKGAIAKEPGRNDLRLKLLEVYYSSKNKDAFEKEAMAFSEDLASRPDSETWEKVVEMGEDLCPNHALFSNAAVASLAATALGKTDIDESLDAITEDEEDTEIMDFDLSEFEDKIDKIGTDEQHAAAPLEEQDEGLDLDLGELMGEDEPEEVLEDTMEITAELEGIADDLKTPEEPVVKQADTDITRRIVTGVAPVSQEITQELDIPDLTGLDLDFASDATMPMDEDLDMDDDALDDIDEVGTKLDLARAYIDMGDPEGARSILDEVIEEGNDEQKRDAEQLIKQI